MGKFDAVDRMMNMAKEKTGKERIRAERQPEAEATLASQFTATEPGVPTAAAEPSRSQLSVEPAQPQVSAAERRRQLMGALQPFLPVVGGAIGMVDHSAARAVSRLLPLLSGSGALRAIAGGEKPSVNTALDPKLTGLEQQLKEMKSRLDTQEEQLGKARESLERAVAEQGTLSHRSYLLENRLRRLTIALIVLFILLVALGVSLFVFSSR